MARALSLFAALLLVAAARPARARIATEPIREVIHAAEEQYAACADRCVRCAPGAYRVAIRFTIEATGAVSEAEVASATPPVGTYSPNVTPMAECIRQVVLGLVFPSFHGSTRAGSVGVTYPFAILLED